MRIGGGRTATVVVVPSFPRNGRGGSSPESRLSFDDEYSLGKSHSRTTRVASGPFLWLSSANLRRCGGPGCSVSGSQEMSCFSGLAQHICVVLYCSLYSIDSILFYLLPFLSLLPLIPYNLAVLPTCTNTLTRLVCMLVCISTCMTLFSIRIRQGPCERDCPLMNVWKCSEEECEERIQANKEYCENTFNHDSVTSGNLSQWVRCCALVQTYFWIEMTQIYRKGEWEKVNKLSITNLCHHCEYPSWPRWIWSSVPPSKLPYESYAKHLCTYQNIHILLLTSDTIITLWTTLSGKLSESISFSAHETQWGEKMEYFEENYNWQLTSFNAQQMGFFTSSSAFPACRRIFIDAITYDIYVYMCKDSGYIDEKEAIFI